MLWPLSGFIYTLEEQAQAGRGPVSILQFLWSLFMGPANCQYPSFAPLLSANSFKHAKGSTSSPQLQLICFPTTVCVGLTCSWCPQPAVLSHMCLASKPSQELPECLLQYNLVFWSLEMSVNSSARFFPLTKYCFEVHLVSSVGIWHQYGSAAYGGGFLQESSRWVQCSLPIGSHCC